MEFREGMALLMVAASFATLLLGFPVAFTLAGMATLFMALGAVLGAFDTAFVGAIPLRIFGLMTNEVLVAIPLFIFMGFMLERSKVADDLLENAGRLFGRLPGGLGISVTLMGALLAASTGIVGATVVTMGLLSLPTMLRWRYNPGFASGVIVASGTLGQIIPPSIILVLLGDVLSSSYQKVQLQQGIFSPEVVSVSDLFAGATIPGLLLVALFLLYQLAIALLRPDMAPAARGAEADPRSVASQAWAAFKAMIPPVLLVVGVLGSILGGIATPTESAAIGAVGTVLLAGLRFGARSQRAAFLAAASLVGLLMLAFTVDLRIARSTIPTTDLVGIVLALIAVAVFVWGFAASLLHAHKTGILQEVMLATTKTTTMIFVIIIGAAIFSLTFRGFGGDALIEHQLANMPGGVVSAMLMVMAIMFVLGFFLDAIEIIYVVVPIVAPALLLLDVSPVWLGVMMALNLQTSYLTPPFGLALFFFRGVAPAAVSTLQIYRGVIPFIILQLLCLAAVGLMPRFATWLPNVLFGS